MFVNMLQEKILNMNNADYAIDSLGCSSYTFTLKNENHIRLQ